MSLTLAERLHHTTCALARANAELDVLRPAVEGAIYESVRLRLENLRLRAQLGAALAAILSPKTS